MAADGEYVRWVNCKEPGTLMFVTTTILGYTPVFRNPSEKEHLISLLSEACLLHGAALHAFCVMDHHLHLVIRSPMHMTMSKFMQSFKRHSGDMFPQAGVPPRSPAPASGEPRQSSFLDAFVPRNPDKV